MINFKANLLSTAKVKMYTNGHNCKDCNVSFVQLNTDSKSDFRTICEVDSCWENKSSLANDIRNCFQDCVLKKETDKTYFYALTKQRNNFENLDSDEILGLAQVTEESSNEVVLDYLQSDPENNYFSYRPSYRKIGTAIMNCLEQLFSGRKMTLYPIEEAKSFYEKLGFKYAKDNTFLSKKF